MSARDIILSVTDLAGTLGITPRAIQKRAQREEWPFQNGNGRGGAHRKYSLAALPGDVQARYVSSLYKDTNHAHEAQILQGRLVSLLPALAPEALAAYQQEMLPIPTMTERAGNLTHTWSVETAISEKDLRDPRVRKILAILREADAIPRNWTKGARKWVEAVAETHDVTWQSIYRWRKKYEAAGLFGICHRKSTKGGAIKWTPDALEWWVSLCLKREHRKIDKKDLYDILVIEADKKGWRIGSYASALSWYRKRATPTMLAMQHGGLRALDNILPPVLRDYSDLNPFELLVGDQHRFDFWVMDDDTGEVFRPEGYLWQDLRTRVIYGAAVDRRYDAQLIGLALRIGVDIYGLWSGIYTDNGRPEISKYMMGINADLRALGAEWETTIDTTFDTSGLEAEEVNPLIILPGTHKKAIVKNAKAKLIEGTFSVIEQILRSVMRLPGSVKRLGDDIHAQDIDHQEAQRLAARGKLPLFSEFAVAMYRALDHYNRAKHHRGVLKEWVWKPRPREARPYDCLKACYEQGWRPRMISPDAADLMFLSKTTRIVNKGRVQFQGDFWEADELIDLHGRKVMVRWMPYDLRHVYIFDAEGYCCTATPAEYSSMKDQSLAQKKIMQKREQRSRIAEQFRAITSKTPDFREYSKVDALERAALLIGNDKRRRAEEQRELNRVRTKEELEREVRQLEELPSMPPKKRPAPERPMFFMDEYSRYEWIVNCEIACGTLSPEDEQWKREYEGRMDADEARYWNAVRECAGA